jgi:hypothetical protein
MKIAITGHTRGIGKAIYKSLEANNVVVGLSKSNGFDINDVDQIVDIAKDCDCFINNAYSDLQQEILLRRLCELWQGQDKMIITIGSGVVDYPRLEKDRDSEPWDYRENKRTLLQTFRKLAYQGNDQPQLRMITPGAVDTDLIKHIDCVKLDPGKVADAVGIMLENLYIKEMTVYGK